MKIGIYGSAAGKISSETKEKAKEIGRQIAKRGHTIITGACAGLPQEAILGANEFCGKCIGFSPAINLDEHVNKYKMPSEGFAEIIFVPKDYVHRNDLLVCRKYRNVSSVSEIDAAIIICGRMGTMNEFTIAYDLGKNIGVLENSGGIANGAIKILLNDINKEMGTKIVYDSEPVSLIDKLISL